MNDSKRIIIIVVLMTLVLVGMVAKQQYTLNTGELVVLKTTPIDPRSLFRGDYVRLNYDISRLSSVSFPVLSQLKHNDAVFIALEKKGEFWETVDVFESMPDSSSEMVVLKGHVVMPLWRTGSGGDELTVKYGVENYFVPEGEGLALEQLRNQDKVSMQIAVDSFGNAGIKAVLVNGHPRYVETLF